jgi:hypothetical protein
LKFQSGNPPANPSALNLPIDVSHEFTVVQEIVTGAKGLRARAGGVSACQVDLVSGLVDEMGARYRRGRIRDRETCSAADRCSQSTLWILGERHRFP